MANIKIPRIIKETVINDKIWQIISFLEDGTEKFDVVYFNKSDAEEMAKELISSKKRVETFKDIEEAIKFLEELSDKNNFKR